MVVISLVGTAGVLSYKRLTDSYRQYAGRVQFQADLARAKSEALNEGARSVVRFNETGSGYTVGIDFHPFNDPPAIEETLVSRDFPQSIIATPQNDIIFDSRGFSVDSTGYPTSVTLTFFQNSALLGRINIAVTGIVTLQD